MTTTKPKKPASKMAVAKPAKPVALRESSLRMQQTIIDAALLEFSDKGYDGGRVDEIALKAGINKNVLYHHFGSKDGLFIAVLRHTYENIRAKQQDLQLRTLDPETAMRRLVVFTGRIWVQYPEFQRLLMSENLIGGRHAEALASVSPLYNPLMETIKLLLQRGRESKIFRDDVDPTDLYISITSLTAHYVNNQYTFEAIFKEKLMSPQRVKQRLDHAADMIVRFLLKH
jgi:TetR/AcrR family transcriptional regulator